MKLSGGLNLQTQETTTRQCVDSHDLSQLFTLLLFTLVATIQKATILSTCKYAGKLQFCLHFTLTELGSREKVI